VLRSTLAGLEDGTPQSADQPAVSDLKRSVVRAVANMELRKLENESFEHAGQIAALLSRAGRAAYVVHPSLREDDFAAQTPLEATVPEIAASEASEPKELAQ
jgi:hypothetical protein